MPIIRFTAEDIRNPYDSRLTLVHNEDANDCYGDLCGNYHEESGEALRPRLHSHLVITGHDPATTPRYHAISK